MKRNQQKRLRLNSETVRLLNAGELVDAKGGLLKTSDLASECQTCSCVTCQAPTACPCPK